MNTQHQTTSGIMVDIAKGWKPNMYLSNLSMSYFQDPSYYVAPSVFPICPVAMSIGQYYIFNKAEMAKDQVSRKPQFGKVETAIFSHSEATYSCKVDQVIIGIDNISSLNYQRSNAPAAIDPRRNKTKMATEQMRLHLDRVFARSFFKKEAWENVKTGKDVSPGNNEFLQFNDANMDIIGFFDDLKRNMLLNGRRMPNKLTLGYDTYVALKNHPQFLERVTGSGSTPNPALVNEQVISTILGIPTIKVLYSTENTAELGQDANMNFVCDSNAALLCYAPDTPALDEPSAGYIFTWDMLGNGQWMAMDVFEGEGGTHSEFVEGLMSTEMKKTCDDLAVFLDNCSKKG